MKTNIDVICDKRRILSSGEYPLVIRLTQNRKRKYIRIGISLNAQHWDSAKNKLKANCPNREYIEKIITEKLSLYQKQVLEFQCIGKEYTLSKLVETIDKPTKRITVDVYLKEIIKILVKENHIGNSKHYEALLNSLQKFTNLSQVLFVDIDISFLNKYETFLRNEGNKGNTINIKMRTLKAVYNRAIKDGIVKQDYYPFQIYNVSKLKETTPKRSITKEDIQKIMNFDVFTITKRPWSLIQLSKDLFLFSYLGCGINLVDMAYLKRDNIVSNRIVYKRQKTKKQINFQLQPYAIEILSRYKSLNGDYLFPILNDTIHLTPEQQYRRIKKVTYVANKSLKKIGEAIGLPISLTSYVARHSFATVLKRSGVNIALISEAMGHSDLKTTQIYLDSFENNQIDEAMGNLL